MANEKEWHAFILALIIIVFFVIVSSVIVFSSGLEALEQVVAILGGYVATILVYYYGRQTTQTLTGQVEDYKEERNTAFSSRNQALEEANTIRTQALPAIIEGQNASSEFIQSFDNAKQMIRKYEIQAEMYQKEIRRLTSLVSKKIKKTSYSKRRKVR